MAVVTVFGFLVTFATIYQILGPADCRSILSSRSLQPRSPAAKLFLHAIGKRALALEKCSPVSACAMLQIQPGTSSYWVDEICQCGGEHICSLEWDENPIDGRSVNNADTQLKLCRPVFELPSCISNEPAVVSTLETSIAHPSIRQGASVVCNCPIGSHEFKLLDAGMMDEGDRTVVTAKFECVPVVHCRALQPCKFLAVLPTGENLTHYTCQCASHQRCPSEFLPNEVLPARLNGVAYYPFFCHGITEPFI